LGDEQASQLRDGEALRAHLHLNAKAHDLRKREPQLPPEQAFSKVYGIRLIVSWLRAERRQCVCPVNGSTAVLVSEMRNAVCCAVLANIDVATNVTVF